MIGNLTFAANTDKRRSRAFFGFLAVALSIMAVSFLVFVIQDRPPGDPTTLAVDGAGFVALVLGGTVPWIVIQQGADDWLRLDAAGLTLRRRGRESHWPWECLVDARRHGRLHPAAPFLGRFITVHVKDGGGPPFPGGPIRMLLPRNTITIGNDYIAPTDRIASLLSAVIAEAYTGPKIQDEALLEAKAPEIFILSEPGHYMRLLKLIAAVFGGAAAIVLIFAFLKSGLDWRNIYIEYIDLVPLFFMTSFGMTMFQSGYPRDFLLLSDDGLTVREEGRRWLWAWGDVIEMGPLNDADADPKSPNAEPGSQFTIHTKPDTTQSWTQVLPTPTEIIVKGLYDTPIDEIARRMEIWRAAASGGGA